LSNPMISCGQLETILLVEDNDILRELLSVGLQSNGYEVLPATNSTAAASICKCHRGPIHLLLTDVIMPGISGTDLAKQVLPIRPRMKVLYMSGLSANEVADIPPCDVGAHFIGKPFHLCDLTNKIQELLCM
jgi:two-component system, cell cycle sensor histidine kinase and response regulator CckA